MAAHVVNHLRPAQAARQHQITDKHADIRRGRQHVQCLLTAFRFKGQVAKLMQLLAQGLANIGLIFQYQHQPFVFSGCGGRVRFIFRDDGQR